MSEAMCKHPGCYARTGVLRGGLCAAHQPQSGTAIMAVASWEDYQRGLREGYDVAREQAARVCEERAARARKDSDLEMGIHDHAEARAQHVLAEGMEAVAGDIRAMEPGGGVSDPRDALLCRSCAEATPVLCADCVREEEAGQARLDALQANVERERAELRATWAEADRDTLSRQLEGIRVVVMAAGVPQREPRS